MPSLNQYASRIAGIVGRQADHALLERVKDAFKVLFAARIRQSISRNGIDDLLLLTCELPIVIDESISINGFKVFKTSSRVPVPVRYQNDSMFTYVGFNDGVSFSNRTLLEVRMSSNCDVNGFLKYYRYTNGYIQLFVKNVYENLLLSVANVTKVKVTTIFESPEDIISVLDDIDANDAELPFPNDMVESIIQELLKTEFGYMPPETEIKT